MQHSTNFYYDFYLPRDFQTFFKDAFCRSKLQHLSEDMCLQKDFPDYVNLSGFAYQSENGNVFILCHLWWLMFLAILLARGDQFEVGSQM